MSSTQNVQERISTAENEFCRCCEGTTDPSRRRGDGSDPSTAAVWRMKASECDARRRWDCLKKKIKWQRGDFAVLYG